MIIVPVSERYPVRSLLTQIDQAPDRHMRSQHATIRGHFARTKHAVGCRADRQRPTQHHHPLPHPSEPRPARPAVRVCPADRIAGTVDHGQPQRVSFSVSGGLVSAIGSLATAIAAYLFARVARLGPAVTVPAAFVLSGLGILGLALASSVPVAILSAVVAGLGNGLLLPALLTWALGNLTFAQRGRGTGSWTSSPVHRPVAVHAWPHPPPQTPAPLHDMHRDWHNQWGQAEWHLAQILADHTPRYPDIPVHPVVTRDRPARALRQHAQDATLLVIGHRHQATRPSPTSVSNTLIYQPLSFPPDRGGLLYAARSAALVS
jgi:hypothetical protein